MNLNRLFSPSFCAALLVAGTGLAGCSNSGFDGVQLENDDSSDTQSNSIELRRAGESSEVRYPSYPVGSIAMRTSVKVTGPEGSVVEDESGQLYYPSEVADQSFNYLCNTAVPDRTFTLTQVGTPEGVVTVELAVEWETCPTAGSADIPNLTPLQIELCSVIADPGADVRIEQGCELPNSSAIPEPALIGDADAGKQAFGRCRACHKAAAGARSSVGPNLFGVFNRRAASAEGFTRYSSAMKTRAANGLVWDSENLNAFLVNTKGFVQRTKMPRQRLTEERRNDLIAYLATLHE